jgi:hypothetical protein
MRPNETEHSPLTKFDEYPIHQFQEPLRVVETTDARAFERYWFTAADQSGEFFLVTGFGIYPNLDTADAYAVFVHDGKQTTVRMHRLLGDDRADLSYGPLSAEVVEPFREWRLTLADNDQDFTFDLRWRDTKRAVFERMMGGHRGSTNLGRLIPGRAGYESFGRIEGTVELKGQRFTLDPARVRGSRDHHWGLRNGVGGPGHMEPMPRFSHCGQWVEFGDWSIWGSRCLYNLGDDKNPGAMRVVKAQHRLRFDPDTNHFIGGIITNTLANGEVKEIHYEQIGSQVAYLRTGGYGIVPDQGSPDDRVFHGMHVTDDLLVVGRTDDVTDPKVTMHLAGFDDHLCVARCGDEEVIGIIECMNPVLFEMCRDGIPGYALLEN